MAASNVAATRVCPRRARAEVTVMAGPVSWATEGSVLLRVASPVHTEGGGSIKLSGTGVAGSFPVGLGSEPFT